MGETMVSAMLRRTRLFADLSVAERLTLAGTLRRLDVPAGQHVVRAGSLEHAFFLVSAGRLKVVLRRRGREVVLAELGPGDYFGELSVIDGQPRSADVVTLTRAELYELAREAFFRLLDAQPAIARKLLVGLCASLREADRQIGNLATLDATGRIIRAVLKLAERQARREGTDLVFPRAPRQQHIAALAGTTRATTSRVMHRLARRGLLSMTGRSLVVHERQVLLDEKL